MRKPTDGQLAIGALIAFALWIFVALPVYYGEREDNSAAYNCAAQENKNYGLWEKTRCDPVAYFTAWLVGFTSVLAGSTIGLWIVTWRSGVRQSSETTILQRAYLSVEPAGVNWLSQPNESHPVVEIGNVGHLPARNVRWVINNTISRDDRLNDFSLKAGEIVGDNTVPPGTKMLQGGDIIHVGIDVRKERGLYLYVWGAAWYDDGFGVDRITKFCHRYNCINLTEVWGPSRNGWSAQA